ncbi:MAG: DUF2249 domain-containing protein [Proteobacteria bacterium]|nr:DUF2249 domain-containing protein [Pseudomonadota bacterium]
MNAEVFLDARLMEPPDPLMQGMATLAALSAGQFFHMRHRMAPRMLYPELAAMGLTEQTLQLGPDDFHLIAWSATDSAACTAARHCCEQLRGKQEPSPDIKEWSNPISPLTSLRHLSFHCVFFWWLHSLLCYRCRFGCTVVNRY